MDKNNNLMLVTIAILFGALFFSYMYRTGQIPGNFQEDQEKDQQNDWQNDQNWQQRQTPPKDPGWQNTPPKKPKPKREREEDPLSEDPLSYKQAVRLSQQTGKNMLLFFTSDWCTHCKDMKKSTMQNSRVKQELKKFVYYEVDTSKERDVSQKYRVQSIPSYHIVNSQEKSLKRGQGGISSSRFIRWMNNGRIFASKTTKQNNRI